jgi:hypothetical protein
MHFCVFDDDNDRDEDDDIDDSDDDDDDDGKYDDDDDGDDAIGDDNNDDDEIIRCARYLKQTTLRSSTLEALEIIYPPSARFVLPPSAPLR